MEKIYVFDFDDTLFDLTAFVKIRNKKNNKVVKTFSAKEFADIELALPFGYYLDFSDYKNPNIQYKPLPLFDFFKKLYNQNRDIAILTARSFETSKQMENILKANNIDLNRIKIFFSGLIAQHGVSAEKAKLTYLLDLFEDYDTVFFYDNSYVNITYIRNHVPKEYKNRLKLTKV